MVTSNEFRRLRTLVEGNMATEEETARFSELVAQQQGGTPAIVPASASRATVSTEDDEYAVTVDIPAFERGGMVWQPPKSGEGRLPGICVGLLSMPDRDSLGFLFKGVNSHESFFGSLMCGNLTNPDKSAAWKLKDVLTALGATYTVSGNRVVMAGYKGKPCDVEWQYIDNQGRRELRIQNVYPSNEKLESL